LPVLETIVSILFFPVDKEIAGWTQNAKLIEVKPGDFLNRVGFHLQAASL